MPCLELEVGQPQRTGMVAPENEEHKRNAIGLINDEYKLGQHTSIKVSGCIDRDAQLIEWQTVGSWVT